MSLRLKTRAFPPMSDPTAADTNFHQTVSNWEGFNREWGGLHNFLLDGEITAGFDFELPPLETIIEEVRRAPGSVVRSGRKAAGFDLTDVKAEFNALPLDQAMQRPFVLAHFKVHPELTGPGQVFEDLQDRWVEPWKQRLRDHDFDFDNVFVALFCSGPDSASNYHMDYTHQLAWQRYGSKHFLGFKDHNHWTTPAERGRCQLKEMIRPAGITPADTYTLVQTPGTVLWNAHTTPHWVDTHDGCAATLTLVHDQLRHNGELCPHAQLMNQWRKENGFEQPNPQVAVKPAGNYR